MGIHWDGNGQIHFYTSAATATGTELGAWTRKAIIGGNNVPTDSNLALMLLVETGASSTKSVIANYIRGAWTV